MLEHTQNDGTSWSVVGPIGTEPFGDPLLATTPQLPGHLCAAALRGQTDHVTMLASTDSGHSWQVGAMPTSFPKTTAETSTGMAIGANGDCYLGYHYADPHDPKTNDYTFWQLSSTSPRLTMIPLSTSMNAAGFVYVPTARDMPARIVVNSELPPHTWASVFSGPAAETDDGQLIWRTVP